MNIAEKKAQIAQAIDAGDYALAARLGRDLKVSATRDYFMKNLVLEDQEGQPTSVELTVHDWKDIKLFMQEPPTPEHNPGGEMFESLLYDTKDAIDAQDNTRFLANLLLIYKAIRRA